MSRRPDAGPLLWTSVVSVAALAAMATVAPALLRFIRYVNLALHYAPPLDPQEGFALWEASQLRSGHGLYVPLQLHSFVSAPYPPLQPLLMVVIGSQVGPNAFWGGRMLSLLAILALALGAVVLVRRVTGSWLGGVAAALLILAQAPFQLWSMRIKPDPIGLVFTLIGLSVVAAQPGVGDGDRRGGRWLEPLLWAIPFALAHFTKQTLVAGPLAAGTLLLLRDRGAALRFGIALAALIVLPWLALDLVTHGQYSYHIWVLHNLGWKFALWLKLVGELRVLWPAMLLGVAGLIAAWKRPTVINSYLLWAPLSLLGAGVQGAHHNHLLETGLALALAGGQALGFAITTSGLSATRPRWRMALVLAVPLLAVQWSLLAAPSPWFLGEYTPDPQYGRFITFMRATPGEILADDVGLLYAAGRPLRYDDPSTMGPAAARGLWDESGLLDDIRNQRFSAIVIPINVPHEGLIDPSGHWTPTALQTIDTYYQVKFADVLTTYVPRR